MNRKYDSNPQSSTSSFGSPPDTSPVELAALGEHLQRCTGQRGALFSLRCIGDTMNDFAAPRLMTTLALFALLGAIASLLT